MKSLIRKCAPKEPENDVKGPTVNFMKLFKQNQTS